MGTKSWDSEVILTQAILSSSLSGPHSRVPAQGNTLAKMDKRQATKTLKWGVRDRWAVFSGHWEEPVLLHLHHRYI